MGASTQAEPPARPPSDAGAGTIVLALVCAFLSGATFGILVMDFGAHVDGVGIGLEWSRPLGSEYGWRAGFVLAASLTQGGLSLVAFSRTRARSFGVLGLVGIAFFGLLVGAVSAGGLLPWWWKLGCNRGQAFACYAAAGVTEGEASRSLDERACAGDVGRACWRIARGEPTRLAAICEQRTRACAAPSPQSTTFRGCNSLREICGGVDPRAP